jgi:hypothetical protein
MQYPGVRRAAATFRWTGSWYTVFLTITTVEFVGRRAISLGSVLDRGGMASERSEYF